MRLWWEVHCQRHSLSLSAIWWRCIAAVANLQPTEVIAQNAIAHVFGGDHANA